MSSELFTSPAGIILSSSLEAIQTAIVKNAEKVAGGLQAEEKPAVPEEVKLKTGHPGSQVPHSV